MNELIMRALVKGFSDWITAVFQTAARKGLLILFLTGQTIGCIFAIIHLLNRQDEIRQESKAEIGRVSAEYSQALNIANLDWRACEEKRQALEVQFAALKARVDAIARRK